MRVRKECASKGEKGKGERMKVIDYWGKADAKKKKQKKTKKKPAEY